MAAPQRRPRSRTSAGGAVRERDSPKGVPKKAPGGTPKWKRRREAWRGRRFVVLVVVPVLLMLGSVYVHTVAARLGNEVVRLEEEKKEAESEAERLEVKITELSEPGRIRALARGDLDMQDPNGEDLETYDGSDGEDVVDGGGEKKETGE
ncbi:MAG: cell division protein FtsL [Actinobacteria bacterium]|nr:cell division protein FtsL [Actinomycetota bacterium]